MRVFLIFFFAIGGLAAFAGESYFVSDPTLTPDGQTVVFVHEGDLWTVPSTGGQAFRLTAMTGRESAPSVSPDGRWLAFSAEQDGNPNVYVMPLAGGDVVQLTFHDASDTVDSWSWDSDSIYFTSSRENNFTQFKIAAGGGTPTRLFDHYFNTIHGAFEHPKTDEIFFTDSWESFRFANRKRYKGAYNPDIKSYNFQTGELRAYTDYIGKDFWHSIDRDGNVYFVSDEANDEYNLYALRNGLKTQLTDFDVSIERPRVSADGSKVVFVKDYQLHIYDTAAERVDNIAVKTPDNDTLSVAQAFDVKGNLEDFDVSPDGKKLAFVSRGELFVSDIEGKFVSLVRTQPLGRVFEVRWLADNRTLIFNQTVEGWRNWFTIAADGSGGERRLTDEARHDRLISLNADRSRALYISGRDQLRYMDLASFESKTLVEDEFWGLYSSLPTFSPDDRYALYKVYRGFEGDVRVYDFETESVSALTDTGLEETDPVWSPDAKDVYFIAGLEQPNYPRGNNDPHVYRLPLYNYDAPFKAKKLTELFAEKDKEDDAEKSDDNGENDEDNGDDKKKDGANGKDGEKPAVIIDFERMRERWEPVSPETGRQYGVFAAADGDKIHVFYFSNHDGDGYSLWRATREPFEEDKTEKIGGGKISGFGFGGGARMLAHKKTLYALIGGKVSKMKLGGGKLDAIDIAYKFERNLRHEFEQMFQETWANMQQNFYNGDFHGVDWAAMRARYAAFLPHVRTRENLRTLLNDLLGELNSSHVGFASNGEEEKIFYDLDAADTGILWEADNPYVVKRVLRRSTADKADKDIAPGDRLTAVNGVAVDPAVNRQRYFAMPDANSGRELVLTFARDGETHDVYIHPQRSFQTRANHYDEWIDACQQRVDKKTDKRVAYVHMKNMGGGSLDQFITEMTSEAHHRDGLILDLRYNTGGNVHDDVLRFLSQRPYSTWRFRGGAPSPQPHFAPSGKPMVLLINEQSLSDAEMTANGFKELGLGTIIGTETYRWIIFTSGMGLVDGSFHRLPAWGCYNLAGDNLELTGVKPDIHVKNTVKDRLEGDDPQLDRAIEEVMKQLQ